MSLAMFLEMFRLFSSDQLYMTPQSQEVAAVIARLPLDPETYDALADEAFKELLTERDVPDSQSFQRFTDILSVLLYKDGRTFTACLRVAQMARRKPACSVFGINALAALANYMRRGRPLPISKRELFATFHAMEEDDNLTHNAGECIAMLSKDYPDEARK